MESLPLSPDLLELLACPACHAPVELNEDADQLVCTGCGRTYRIEQGIPVMLIEDE
jgi:uncharacterized protein